MNDLTTPAGIRDALLRVDSREPTDDEHEGMDGLDRCDYFQRGYETALREFALRLPWSGVAWTDYPIDALGDPPKPPYPGAPIREGRVVGLSGKLIALEINGHTYHVPIGRVTLCPGRAEWGAEKVTKAMVLSLLKERA